jgi:energy-coupling factor transport system ATP-binding protein
MSIVVERLTYDYARNTPTEHRGLHEVSLEIPDGACVAIVGVTGSGKSTLAQHFNGLLIPSEGSVTVDGVRIEPRGLSRAQLFQLRQRVGLLFQFPEAQLFAETIFEDVAFGPLHQKISASEVKERVRWAMEAVALPSDDAFLQRSPFALSGGQRRRVALAGVLTMRPRTLVLDEPTAGLDAEARDELYAQLGRLRAQEGLTAVLISHDMSEVAALAQTVFVLAKSELRLAGPPAEIFLRPAEIEACGLLPPPLAQVVALAGERGAPIPAGTPLTPDAIATALVASTVDAQGIPPPGS